MSDWGFFTWVWKLCAWSWILLGLWWLFRPRGMQKRLDGRLHRTSRRGLFVVLFVCGGVLFGAARDVGGLAGVVLFVIGIIAILKGLLLLRARAGEAILEWWRDRPLWFYRLAALGLVAAGILLDRVT